MASKINYVKDYYQFWTQYNKLIPTYSMKINDLWLLNPAVAEVKYMYKDNDNVKVWSYQFLNYQYMYVLLNFSLNVW